MELLTLPWWTWLLFGLVLVGAELLVTSGFFLFFFGVGAAVTAAIAFTAEVTGSQLLGSFILQGLCFLGISALCVAVLRKPLLARIHFRNQHPHVNSLVGQSAKALEMIEPQAVGRVELHGSAWSALNIGRSSIPPNQKCHVDRIDGITLHVKV